MGALLEASGLAFQIIKWAGASGTWHAGKNSVAIAADLGRTAQSVASTNLEGLTEAARQFGKERAVLIGVGGVYRPGTRRQPQTEPKVCFEAQ